MNIAPIVQSASSFLRTEQLDARRIFHGRGHLFPGLEHICVDWYPPLLLITAYAEVEDVPRLTEALLQADVEGQILTVALQRRYERGAPTEILHGTELSTLIVTEGKLRFEIHPGSQQNHGLFLDMRCLRSWLLENSVDAKVLNLFAYTCSLSVAALAGGAQSVTNVDMSKPSIKWGEHNHLLNEQDLGRVRSIPHNIFKSWGKIKQYGRYDLVIIDPPTRQRGSFDAAKNYGAIVKKLRGLCLPQANVIATINSPFLSSDFLLELFEKHIPAARYLGEMPVAPEFADQFPERGLNICRFEMPGRSEQSLEQKGG